MGQTKNLGLKKFWVRKNFASEIFFLLQPNIGTSRIVNQKKNWAPKNFRPEKNFEAKKFRSQKKFVSLREGIKEKTRTSLDSEAATMYKQKGKSLNMQTGQGFK